MEGVTMEAVTPGNGHLDTVRALHQTVVSLRTALELSKNELKELKQKYIQHSSCLDYADVIEKLTLENHILRRKIIDSGFDEKDSSQNIKLQVTYSPRNDVSSDNEIIIQTATDVGSNVEKSDSDEPQTREGDSFCGVEKLDEIEEQNELSDLNNSEDNTSPNEQVESKSEITLPKVEQEESLPSFKTKLELLSKFDVRIKVRTIKEGTILSSTTSDTESTIGDSKEKDTPKETDFKTHFEEEHEHIEKSKDKNTNKINLKTISTENITMAVPNEEEVKSKVDKFDVQVRITSEENLVVEESLERQKKDTLNLDVDDLSLRSMSEGDNSVFSETGVAPADTGAPDYKTEENASGNESEEVDDIELIFTTDESRDMSNLQEDLVSIKETELWAPTSASTHSTPVLIKFHTLDPEFPPGNDQKDHLQDLRQKTSTPNPPESTLKVKRVSLPNDKEIRHVAFTTKSSLDLPGRGILKSSDNKSDISLFRRSPNISTRKLDSVDSLSCDYARGLSFDTKSSSFELGSSMDMLSRGDSVDSFHKTAYLGHRFSVFAETDISKCGISEEDLAHNMYLRRNTCPNPFQYRPSLISRGPMKPPCGPRPRPVLRGPAQPRRENGAQTDVSALPPRWSSDGYLAYKMPSTPLAAPSVPQRVAPPARRLLLPQPRPEARPALSDIGFTSMVPELSRSADPVWAMARRAAPSPTNSTTSTAKYMSRGTFRSPCLSVDKSNEWMAPIYVPTKKTGFRSWRTSLPDVRQDDTDDLLEEAESFLRRSTENLRSSSFDEYRPEQMGAPYIPGEPRHLRLGHTVKVITPQGRVAVGRVRYVGLAGNTSSTSSIVVGAEFPHTQYPGLPRNDGTHHGRRYFLTATHCTALFVPFSKVVMAWAN